MDLDYQTNNSMTFSKIVEPGECMAMSCDWARVTLTHGKSRRDLLNESKWHIGQSAYEKGTSRRDEEIIQAMGLRLISAKRTPVHAGATVASTLIHQHGTFVWGIVGPGGGHAMGYRRGFCADTMGRESEVIEFFDPNFGLYVARDALDFKRCVTQELTTHYADLLEHLDVYEVGL